jgi:hypothetical protein
MISAMHEALRWWLSGNRAVLGPVLDTIGRQLTPQHFILSVDSHILAPSEPLADVDLLELVLREDRSPDLGVLVEVQLRNDLAKRYSWPGYLGGALFRYRCEAVLVIACLDTDVAGWAKQTSPDHDDQPFRTVVLGPDEWDDLACRAPNEPALELLAWICGRRLESLPAEISSHLARIRGLDIDSQRRYLGLLRTAIRRLPAHVAEVIMNQMKPFVERFAIHPQEIEWEEQGILKGREEGRGEGREEGREEGRREGQKEGKIAALRDLAIQFFGEPAVVERLRHVHERHVEAELKSMLLQALGPKQQ